jgi:acetyl-CoA carboxylase biotin carboxylase subunit
VFRKILIANRGEIALRIVRACRELGVASVVAHSAADAGSPAVRWADEAVRIGRAPARQSYLYVPNVIEAARMCGADAIHPGYGFLSEDADFAEVCADEGIVFIGPGPAAMRRIADKADAKRHMAAAGLPVLPGSTGAVATLAEAEAVAADVGYPLVVKAAAGGGGRGIAVVSGPAELPRRYRETVAAARALFGDGGVYLERFVRSARHVEVQVVADSFGAVVHLGERDCSMQRRRQKLLEEAPAPGLSAAQREAIGRYAVAGARAAGLVGAATFEFLLGDDGAFTFMEINARIQVEHPVTEFTTGVDLIAEQIRVAAGLPLSFTQDQVAHRGAALECRINAEDPARGFAPTPGRLTVFRPPGGPFTRVDAGVVQGDTVTPHYDSTLAKLIVWAPDRDTARARMDRALGEFEVEGPGVSTTIPFLRRLLDDPGFRTATHSTTSVDALMSEGGPGMPC